MADGGFDVKDIEKVLGEVKTCFEEYKTKNDQRLDEIAKNGDADVLLKEQLDRMDKDLEEKQKRLDQFEASMKRKSTVYVDKDGNEVDLDKKAQKFANTMAAVRREVAQPFTHGDMNAYKGAFDALVRKAGDPVLLGETERKALSVGSDPDGGYVVYPDMSGRIVEQVYETSPMRQYASVQVVSTDSLEGMYDLEQADYGWVEEKAARPETDTPQLGRWKIPLHEMYAYPHATQRILDDAAIDMESWLSAKVADRFARAENAAFVSGNGTTQPRGFLDYAAGTTLPGTIQQINTGADGAFAAAPAGGDKLIDALYALKAPYRANAVWAMNRTTMAGVRKLKDSDGSYLWAPGIAAGQPSTLFAYPVASFEDMPTYTVTGALAIAVGDFRAAYQIVERPGIRVLRDPYTAKPYVGLYSVKRVGGDVVNFEAIKLVKFAQ